MTSGDRSSPADPWDAARYQANARFVPDLGAPVMALLDPQPRERVLDLGCGDGRLTAELAARGATVRGVDASPAMVAAARERGLDARVMDGAALDFEGGFDAVFSNAALHWMHPPESVIDGVWRALEPGGRFVAECGGAGNVGAVTGALSVAFAARGRDWAALNPWYFPEPEVYRLLLRARGFCVEQLTLIPRPTPLPGPLTDWLETFAAGIAPELSVAGRRALYAEVAAALAPALRDADGGWRLDYVRLRFAARKSGRGA